MLILSINQSEYKNRVRGMVFMQKIIKKILFIFFTFVLPCAYYLVLIGYFELMGLNEDDLPEIYTTLITSPFFIVPFYVALAFFLS